MHDAAAAGGRGGAAGGGRGVTAGGGRGVTAGGGRGGAAGRTAGSGTNGFQDELPNMRRREAEHAGLFNTLTPLLHHNIMLRLLRQLSEDNDDLVTVLRQKAEEYVVLA